MSEKPLTGARVVSFESRHGSEMARLVEKLGGTALSAPTLREVPLTDQSEAQSFAKVLLRGECDVLVLLTGVGFQTLLDAMALQHALPDLVRALQRVDIVCRGPKPLRLLKTHALSPRLVAPEPNTSADLLAEMRSLELTGKRVYIQEYGAPTPELIDGLTALGAVVSRVPVYAWQLPEDLQPLKHAIYEILSGRVEVALFTSARQVDHLLQVATTLGAAADLKRAFERIVVASIGPVTSDALRAHQLPVDTEPEHPKMGQLVTHVARQWSTLLASKTPTR